MVRPAPAALAPTGAALAFGFAVLPDIEAAEMGRPGFPERKSHREGTEGARRPYFARSCAKVMVSASMARVMPT